MIGDDMVAVAFAKQSTGVQEQQRKENIKAYVEDSKKQIATP